jgi:hypothetical protein
MAQGLITVRSLAIYAGVRVSLTDHVTFQNRISKDLIDLVPPPPHSIFHLPGRCYAFMIVTMKDTHTEGKRKPDRKGHKNRPSNNSCYAFI